MVVVSLALATVCFTFNGAEQCHPALVGKDTPKGRFTLVQRLTADPGYGGDVLQFHETDKAVYALHRVWTLRPSERRAERLASSHLADRQSITGGCVNVSPEVYDALVRCCSNQSLIIQ